MLAGDIPLNAERRVRLLPATARLGPGQGRSARTPGVGRRQSQGSLYRQGGCSALGWRDCLQFPPVLADAVRRTPSRSGGVLVHLWFVLYLSPPRVSLSRSLSLALSPPLSLPPSLFPSLPLSFPRSLSLSLSPSTSLFLSLSLSLIYI